MANTAETQHRNPSLTLRVVIDEIHFGTVPKSVRNSAPFANHRNACQEFAVLSEQPDG